MNYRKLILSIAGIFFILYALVCTWVYFNQESLIFYPTKLKKDYALNFNAPFEEVDILIAGGKELSGVLFLSPVPRRKLVFFLHGNTGNVEDQESAASFYTAIGYDFFVFDYRGYGKSDGRIRNERQFYKDAQRAYDQLKNRYMESEIVVIGYSIGTAAAAKLAAENKPMKLVLMAPYYSMKEMAYYRYKILPGFLVKYKFETYSFLPKVKAPICIFHGKDDTTIPFNSSKILSGLLRKGDRFVPLNNQGHGGIEEHPVFKREMTRFLE